ncbi:MAG: response regulator [Candidatus Natronoplasma sp.]
MNGSIKLLHVDDEPALLDQAKIFLEREEERLDVTTSQTPRKALELLEKQHFDVIVSDYQMPGMVKDPDGFGEGKFPLSTSFFNELLVKDIYPHLNTTYPL